MDTLVAAGWSSRIPKTTDAWAQRLTERGAQNGCALAIAGDDADAETVLDALLDASAP